MVYLIADADCKYMKIGYTNCTPNDRLKAIAKETGLNLSILFVVTGTKGTENYLHRKFKQHHIKREWFKYRLEISQYFEQIYNDAENVKFRQESTGNLQSDHLKQVVKYLEVNGLQPHEITPIKLHDMSICLRQSNDYLKKILKSI